MYLNEHHERDTKGNNVNRGNETVKLKHTEGKGENDGK